MRGMSKCSFLLILAALLCTSRSWKVSKLHRAQSFIATIYKLPSLNKNFEVYESAGSSRRSRIHANRMVMSTINLEPPGASTLNSINIPDVLPKHPQLVEGQLENGFSYVILPNKNPAGRFEAHLEILSGSAYELEKQQGMAHLLEHVAYMGSPKRQLISGTGSRTNAYTDFHHTVFFASCPAQTPDQFWKKPMLPMALDALLDVMTTNVDDDRLEKERAAVLSEASMVNKMEYRVECQILSSLHSENRISQRFPIGKEQLIKRWTKEDLQFYHSLHYRPDNVILFVVGDVEVENTIEVIKQKFGPLKAKIDAQKIFKDSGEFPQVSMRAVSKHFPPVIHRWSCAKEQVTPLIPPLLIQPPELLSHPSLSSDSSMKDTLSPITKTFSHELLQSFSFHLFAKRPIEPITSLSSLKRELLRRIVLSALQIRLNVMERQEPLFTFADFNQMNWPREGCAVCSFDLTTDPARWREAVYTTLKEIKRLGLYGLTQGELTRYKQSSIAEAMQLAVQSSAMTNEEVLQELMESEASGHTYLHPLTRYELVEETLTAVTLEDANAVARELCEHLSSINGEKGVYPSAIVACAPILTRDGNSFSISEQEVIAVVEQALLEEVEPIVDTPVPDTLLAPSVMEEKAKYLQPRFVPLEGKAQREYKTKNPLGLVQRKLSNGIRMNMLTMKAEPQRIAMRMFVPGGRWREDRREIGSVLIGCRTIQEGGAFLDMTREEVELFCIDHQVMVEVKGETEGLVVDFTGLTSTGPTGGVTGFEALLQVAHILLTDFKYEEDAFNRAILSYHEQFDSIVKGLESACQESLLFSLSQGDGRVLSPNHKQLDLLNLETVKRAIQEQLQPHNIEFTISGDLDTQMQEQLVLRYLGTVPTAPPLLQPNALQSLQSAQVEKMHVKVLGSKQQLGVYLPDSDERAVGYLSGPAPNKYGLYASGESVSDLLYRQTGKRESRWEHPLFGSVVLSIFQEVANRRLFSVVREERQLTYDASFQFNGHEMTLGSYYTVSVTSNPSTVQQAVKACVEALTSLGGNFGVLGDSVTSAKRSLLQRYRAESATNKFYLEQLAGSQLDSLPLKVWKNVGDYEQVVQGVTVQDVQALVKLLKLEPDNMTICVGIAAPQPPKALDNLLTYERLIEILDERDKKKGKSPGHSGLHTPIRKTVAGNNTTRSVGYYFDELNNHFRANNDMNHFGITLTKYVCQIYDGKKMVHQVPVDADDSTSVRNLYLMLHACDYNVLSFLAKIDGGEFG